MIRLNPKIERVDRGNNHQFAHNWERVWNFVQNRFGFCPVIATVN
jgi:hypothetical protein